MRALSFFSAAAFYCLLFLCSSMPNKRAPGAYMVTSTAEMKMRAVSFLASYGFVHPPADLFVMKPGFPASVTSQWCCAIMGGPNKMEPLAKAKSTAESLRLFSKGTPGTDRMDFSGRKGRLRWIQKITDGNVSSPYTYDNKDTWQGALEEWSTGLEEHCNIAGFDLTTFDGLIGHKNACYEYHTSRYAKMKKYSILQPWRIIMWPFIVSFIEHNPHYTVGQFIEAGILVDMKGNMDDFASLSNADFKRSYGFDLIYWPIHSCLIENLTEEMLKIPGVMDVLSIKIRNFRLEEGRDAGLKMLVKWVPPIIFELAKTMPIDLAEMTGSSFYNLVENSHLIPVVRELVDVTTDAIMVGSFGGTDAYLYMRATVRPDDVTSYPIYCVITAEIWKETFVTILPVAFQKDFKKIPGRFFNIISGHRNGPSAQSQAPELFGLSVEQEFNSLDVWCSVPNNEVVVEFPCSIAYQMPSESLYCAQYAAMNAAAALGFNCDTAYQVIQTDMRLDEGLRKYEPMRLPEFSNEFSRLVRGIELCKTPKGEGIMTVDYLLSRYVSGPHDPLLITIGAWHTVAVITNQIHCACEAFALALNKENLQICSDFTNEKGTPMILTAVRYVRISPGYVIGGSKQKRKRKN